MKAGLFFNPKKQQDDFIKTHKKLGSALRNTNKTPTGILDLDQITNGGLARGRATLLVGGAGAGKSLLALQTLVNGAKLFNEPGIFVAFEESSQRIVANAATFGSDLEELQRRKLFFSGCATHFRFDPIGNFDLDGLLAMLASKTREMGATRIVFDAIYRQFAMNSCAANMKSRSLTCSVIQSGPWPMELFLRQRWSSFHRRRSVKSPALSASVNCFCKRCNYPSKPYDQ